MKTYYAKSAEEVKTLDTNKLRENFLVENLFVDEKIQLNYLHYDRIIAFGAKPVHETLNLELSSEIGSKFFLERRECGIINLGGVGEIHFDGGVEVLENRDGLYLPVGNQK
ncbi:5-dehydro-4-deoxy-D-glucuronate isomerase, partial [Mycoplasmopsis pullorum]